MRAAFLFGTARDILANSIRTSTEAEMQTAILDPGASVLISAAVFLIAFLVAGAAGLHFLSRRNSAMRDRGAADPDATRHSKQAVLLNGRLLAETPEPAQDGLPQEAAAGAKPEPDVRGVLTAVLKGLSILIVAFFAAATIAAYVAATPGNGLLLVSMLLAAVTLIVGMHLHKIYRRFARPRIDPARAVPTDLASWLGAALLNKAQVRWELGSPQVHSIDRETLTRAQAMLAEGRSLEEVCRSIDSGYDSWSAPRRQAWQAVLRAAVEHDRSTFPPGAR